VYLTANIFCENVPNRWFRYRIVLSSYENTCSISSDRIKSRGFFALGLKKIGRISVRQNFSEMYKSSCAAMWSPSFVVSTWRFVTFKPVIANAFGSTAALSPTNRTAQQLIWYAWTIFDKISTNLWYRYDVSDQAVRERNAPEVGMETTSKNSENAVE